MITTTKNAQRLLRRALQQCGRLNRALADAQMYSDLDVSNGERIPDHLEPL